MWRVDSPALAADGSKHLFQHGCCDPVCLHSPIILGKIKPSARFPILESVPSPFVPIPGSTHHGPGPLITARVHSSRPGPLITAWVLSSQPGSTHHSPGPLITARVLSSQPGSSHHSPGPLITAGSTHHSPGPLITARVLSSQPGPLITALICFLC